MAEKASAKKRSALKAGAKNAAGKKAAGKKAAGKRPASKAASARGKRKSARSSPIAFKCPTCLGYMSIDEKSRHVCVQPTEASVMAGLDEELGDAWKKLRAFASELGPQRVYCSAKAVMFSKSVCFMFVRPKKTSLELCFFLPREVSHPWIKDVRQPSAKKFAHTVLVRHEDQVEEPLTDWLREAFEHAPEGASST